MKNILSSLYKTLIINKKNIIIFSISLLYIEFLIYSMRFSFIYGNLKHRSEESITSDAFDFFFLLINTFIPSIFSYIVIKQSVLIDFKTGMYKFIFSSPKSEKDIMKEKIIESGIILLFSIILSLILNTIYLFIFFEKATICSYKLESMIYLPLLIIGIIILPLLLFAKIEAIFQKYLLIIICIILIPVVGFSIYATNNTEILSFFLSNFIEKLNKWIDRFSLLIVIMEFLALFLSIIASYYLGVKILKRRDKICSD